MNFTPFKSHRESPPKEIEPRVIDAKEYLSFSENYTPPEIRIPDQTRKKQRADFLAALEGNNLSKSDTKTPDVSFLEKERTFTQLGRRKKELGKLKKHTEQHSDPHVKTWYPKVIEEQELNLELITASKLGDMERFRVANEKINSLPKPELVSQSLSAATELLLKALKNLESANLADPSNVIKEKITDSLQGFLTYLESALKKFPSEDRNALITLTELERISSIQSFGEIIARDFYAPISDYFFLNQKPNQIIETNPKITGAEFAAVLTKILNHLKTNPSIGRTIKAIWPWKVTDKRSERYTLAVSFIDKEVIIRPTHTMNLTTFINRIGHELSHILRSACGSESGFKLLEKGLPNIREAEEGVAILSELIIGYLYCVYTETTPQPLTELPRLDRYLAISLALGLDQNNQVRTFKETFCLMEKYYLAELIASNALSDKKADLQKILAEARIKTYQYCQRAYEGTDGKNAVNTSDLIYAHGIQKITKLITDNPKEISRLFIGGVYDPVNPEQVTLLDKLGITPKE